MNHPMPAIIVPVLLLVPLTSGYAAARTLRIAIASGGQPLPGVVVSAGPVTAVTAAGGSATLAGIDHTQATAIALAPLEPNEYDAVENGNGAYEVLTAVFLAASQAVVDGAVGEVTLDELRNLQDATSLMDGQIDQRLDLDADGADDVQVTGTGSLALTDPEQPRAGATGTYALTLVFLRDYSVVEDGVTTTIAAGAELATTATIGLTNTSAGVDYGYTLTARIQGTTTGLLITTSDADGGSGSVIVTTRALDAHFPAAGHDHLWYHLASDVDLSVTGSTRTGTLARGAEMDCTVTENGGTIALTYESEGQAAFTGESLDQPWPVPEMVIWLTLGGRAIGPLTAQDLENLEPPPTLPAANG